jgi:hypothetical protein
MRPRRRTPEVDPFLIAAALSNSPYPGEARLGRFLGYLLIVIVGLAVLALCA